MNCYVKHAVDDLLCELQMSLESGQTKRLVLEHNTIMVYSNFQALACREWPS
jgi:hypothetical protein